MVVNRTYLQRYVNSKGVELPPDYDDFIEGAIFGRECVFCQHPHTLIPVFRFEPITELRTSTGTYCCNACQTLIDTMVKLEYPQMWKEDARYSKQVDFEEKDWGNRGYKLNLYNVNEQFDHTVESYITHKSKKRLLCYFCGESCSPEDPEIFVPVDTSDILQGGKVKVCQKRCYEDIWENSRPESVHIHQKCVYCSTTYMITKAEFDKRTKLNTLGKHMCPECSYAGSMKEQEDATVLAATAPEESLLARSVYKTCQICKDTFYIDRTLLHSKLKKIHTISNTQHSPRCSTCYIFGRENDGIIILQNNDFYCVLFHLDKTGKNWSYRISKIINNEEKVILRPPTTYKETVFLKCVGDAMNACTEIGIQTELDLDKPF